jgi:hypothetical protein
MSPRAENTKRVFGYVRGSKRRADRPAAVPREPLEAARLSVRLRRATTESVGEWMRGCAVAAGARDSGRAHLCELRPGQPRHRKVLSCVRG